MTFQQFLLLVLALLQSHPNLAADADQDGQILLFDCDDNDPTARRGAVESCQDQADNDCDGVVNDGCGADADQDGYPAPNDCNDANAAVHPGATEVAGDGVDQDCDLQEVCYADADNDGSRSFTTVLSADADCNDPNEGLAAEVIDCDDTNPSRFYGAPEITGDGVDQNCDSVENCYTDADNDGARTGVVDVGGDNNDGDCNDAREGGTADMLDCNDSNATVWPGAFDPVGDGIDQDCDALDG